MPDSASQVLTGTLRSSARGLLALEADDGGVWQLDVGFSWRARRLVGRRVSVLGTRAGFDLLDVTRVEPL